MQTITEGILEEDTKILSEKRIVVYENIQNIKSKKRKSISLKTKPNIFYNTIKRAMDIVLSVFALFFLSPIFFITAFIIKLDSKGPAIYSQRRVGKNKKIFTIYKFRSMVTNAEELLASLEKDNERDGPVFKIAKDPRTTRVGSFIRKTCIDELPQLINIVLGDMSIVGPRPPLEKEVATYNSHQMKRLSVKPGLTCYWQVQKGEETTFDEWVELDLKYIREKSITTDIKLILKTIKVILCGRGDC